MLKITQINDLREFKKRDKLIARLIIFSVIGFTLSQVIPTLADQQSVNLDVQSNSLQEDTGTVKPSAPPLDLSDEISAATSKFSESATAIQQTNSAVATLDQNMKISIQKSVSIDPRAQVTKVPSLDVIGPAFVLICAYSQNSVLDVISKGVVDDQNAQNLYLSGDLSSNLAIAGQTELVISALKAAGGPRLSSLGQRISTASIRLQFISTDKLAQDSSLCSKYAPENMKIVKFSPIGIDLGLKKGEVNLD